MKKHLTSIEIKDFKCFKDFKADGFKRVNIIVGKNNVGKTAFMEALFLIINSFHILNSLKDSVDREVLYYEITKLLLLIEQNRNSEDFLLEWINEEFTFNDYTFEIRIDKCINLFCKNNLLSLDEYEKHNYWNYGNNDITNFRNNKHFNKLYKKHHLPLLDNHTFISLQNNNEVIKDMIDDLKLQNKYDYINNLMNRIFNIEKIDVIKNRVMLQQKGKFLELKEFGDGLKKFFNIVIVLLVNKEKTIFIDEMENGIHYDLLDDLWEIILKISKDQNVQVFATTHSKECIDSYARVSKKLQDEDTCYIKMNKLEDSSIEADVKDYEMFQNHIEDNNEPREN